MLLQFCFQLIGYMVFNFYYPLYQVSADSRFIYFIYFWLTVLLDMIFDTRSTFILTPQSESVLYPLEVIVMTSSFTIISTSFAGSYTVSLNLPIM